jgi:Glycosyltransferase family 87
VNESIPPMPAQRWAQPLFVVLVVLWLAVRILPEAWQQQPFGIVREPNDKGASLRVCDFTSHTRFVRAVWEGDRTDEQGKPLTSVYSAAAHRRMASTWVGKPQDKALPFGYSPTMIWVLTPLAFLPDRLAFFVWMILALALVAWMLSRRGDPWLGGFLIFLSPTAIRCFSQGQTAVFSAAAVLVLLRYAQGQPRVGRTCLAVLVLWALTAKPPFAIAAGAALLACGRWRVVLGAVVLAILSTTLLHPWLGPDWMKDYLTLARTYNSEQADPTFAWCLEPSYMDNLRAALYTLGMGDARSYTVAAGLWVMAQVGILAAGRFGKLSPEVVWALSLLALLLFAPHVNVTEDLHLYVAAVATVGLAYWLPVGFVAMFWLGCLLSILPDWLWPWSAFLGKALLALLVLGLAWRRGRERRNPL